MNYKKVYNIDKVIFDILYSLNIPFSYKNEVKIDNYVLVPTFIIGNNKNVILECKINTIDINFDVLIKSIKLYVEKYNKIILLICDDYYEFIKYVLENNIPGKVIIIPISNIYSNYIRIGVENFSNIDYGHWLSFHKGKCKMLHYHTSWNVSVFVEGYMIEGDNFLIDYGDLKKIVKDELNLIDHKLLIYNKFIKLQDDEYYEIEYNIGGRRKMILPKEEVVVIDFEPTAENISRMLVKNILDKLPNNIIKVELHFNEGTNNICVASAEREIKKYKYIKDIIKMNI